MAKHDGRTKLLPVKPPVRGECEIAGIFRHKGKHVVTFLGFGELGYEDEQRMLAIARSELARYTPTRTIVNTGTLITDGFRHGIADVYGTARALGFATIGIHPSICLSFRDRHTRSAHVDEVFFVQDCTWGGFLDRAGAPSPTLRALVAVSDEVIAIGGGKHTAEELQEFWKRGRHIRFHAADMNHKTSVEWARRHGTLITDFRGAAGDTWSAIHRSRIR